MHRYPDCDFPRQSRFLEYGAYDLFKILTKSLDTLDRTGFHMLLMTITSSYFIYLNPDFSEIMYLLLLLVTVQTWRKAPCSIPGDLLRGLLPVVCASTDRV